MTKAKNPEHKWGAPGLGLHLDETCVPTAALNALLDRPLAEMAARLSDNEDSNHNGHLQLAERVEVILRTENRVKNQPPLQIDTILRKITRIRQERRPLVGLDWADVILLAVGISVSATDLPVLPAGLPAAREMVDSWLACHPRCKLTDEQYEARVLAHLTTLEPYLHEYISKISPGPAYAYA